MHRQSENINATLEVKENKSRSTEAKEEACFPDLSKDQKICKVTESKITMASEKENFSDGNQTPLKKNTSKYTKDLEKESYRNCKDVVNYQLTECFFDTRNRDTFGESTLPLSNKENFSKSRPVSLGSESYLTPNKAEEKSDYRVSEKLMRKPVDFATVTIAEFGITPESFTKQSIEKSPTLLKFRRRSTIGVRGSPENNTLIRYLAHQRRNRQKEPFTQASPFNHQNAGSLKDKIRAFQTSFKSVQEDEGKIGFSGLSQVADVSEEAGCSQNKVPFTEEHNEDQWSEKLMFVYSGDDSRQNFTNSNKADTKIHSTSSSCQDVIVTEPAAAVSKKLICEQQNTVESLEAVLIKDTLETSRVFSPESVTKEDRSNVTSDLTRKKDNFAEELSLETFDETKPSITPLQTGNVLLNECTQSGSHLRSVLKKTPVKQIMAGMKVSDNPVDRRGSESLKVCSTTNISELQAVEETEQHSSEKQKKKKVTFGEDLSPEIFDKTLPANTPLRKGATPVRHPGSQSSSPFTRSNLTEEPLSQPNFDCSDEYIESVQELVKDYVAAEDFLSIQKMEETDRSFVRRTRSCSKRKFSTVSEGIDFSISKTTSAKNIDDAKNPRKTKFQRQKNTTTSAAKKTLRVKHTSYGKRRKKKVKKSLYGEREMASKKPLLSPIPEIPEVFSSTSSPNTPRQMQDKHKTNAVFPDNSKSKNAYDDAQQKKVVERMRGKSIHAIHTCPNSDDLDVVEASSSNDTVFQTSNGDPESISSTDYQFPNLVVPEAKCIFDTSDYVQQGEETACIEEEKSNSLIENKKLRGNFLNKGELLTGLEFLESQNAPVPEDAQRTECSPKHCLRGRLPRRRRNSTISNPYTENFHFETTGNNLPVSSFNVEEVLSAPQLKNDSSEPFRRLSDDSGRKRRVRRSMRLHKDAETEGLAWIQVPDEIQIKPQLLASCCKIRRTINVSVLKESEKVCHREENLIQFSAPAKENNVSVRLADGPCKRWKRKSMCVPIPQETRNWSQTQKRNTTELEYRKDRSNQKHCEEAEISLENQSDN